MCPENIFSDLRNLAILGGMKRKTRPSSRGSVFIETGIALAFMLMMIGGIILIATQLNRYSKVTESLSQAARLGSTVSGLAEDGTEIACSSTEISSAAQTICLRAQRLLTENGVFPATEAGATQALAALFVSHTPLKGEDDKEISNRSVVSVRAEVPLFPIGSVSIGQINVRGASPYLVNESSVESGGSGSAGGSSEGSTGGLGGTSGGGSGSGSGGSPTGSSGTSSKGTGSKGISLGGKPIDADGTDTVGDGGGPMPVSGDPPTDSDDAVSGEDGEASDDTGGLPSGGTPISLSTAISESDDSGGGDESVPASPVPATAVPATVVPPTAVPPTPVPATAIPDDGDVSVIPPDPTVLGAPSATPLSADAG